MIKSKTYRHNIMISALITFSSFLITNQRIQAASETFPHSLGLYVSQFLTPEEVSLNLATVNQFFYKISKSPALRKFSPFGVQLKDLRWSFWKEALHDNKIMEISSFNNLPALLAKIPVSEYKYLLPYIYEKQSGHFIYSFDNLEEKFFKDMSFVDKYHFKQYDECEQALRLHYFLFVMSSLRCNAFNIARSVAIDLIGDDGLTESWKSDSASVYDKIWDLSRDAAMESDLEGVRQDIDDLIKKSLWSQSYDQIKLAANTELKSQKGMSPAAQGKLVFELADSMSRLVIINQLNPKNPEKLAETAFKFAMTQKKEIRHRGTLSAFTTWEKFHSDYTNSLTKNGRSSIEHWLSYISKALEEPHDKLMR